ncbi:restriction endonuclease [Streptomyces sp. PTM05]|uniref:Restriction endonuclease n=1 Tax=Streptantibioticus parmotrematis TaxID=2873249 RepID=A0ABS7R2C0_9ACTN|nr:restriction endonuclease [Streptantibioticus parmotrematis]MBY8889353.1 restriction endonuclease [Streptantibioticus parmotrematis]
MSRRSNGIVGVWAEAQRQRERQLEAQAREQRERERQQRAYERESARQEREFARQERERREADARRRTERLDARVAALQGLLADGCRAPAFDASALTRSVQAVPFSPGPLAQPVALPDPARYQAQGGWTPARRAQAQAEAQARFEQDLYAARAAEAARQRQLAEYRERYERDAEARREEVRRHNANVARLTAAVADGDPEAAVEYFTAALHAGAGWPEGFPRRFSAGYDRAARQLLLDWELPGYDVVPEAKSVRYMPTNGQEKETARPVAQRRALYREALAQCVLLVLHQLFAADAFGALDSVVVNGFVDGHDPVTGRQEHLFLATVMASRPVFRDLRLDQVSPGDCLVDGLRGQLSARPDRLAPVRPVRRPDDAGAATGAAAVPHAGDDDEPDLYTMDPIAFESLVADLFRAMGMRAVTTQRSNDGGVDVDAVDPTPIRGGTIVVQVKRYRNTVSPTAVRDLYGTVQDAGANKGVLVTTSGFGPGSYTFAHGKPLELVPGTQLVDLLHRHGLRGRLGQGERGGRARAAAPDAVPDEAGRTDADNVLGLSWSGHVALDVCALVCRGDRVLSDEHLVFFNNPATPDHAVRAHPAGAPDKAAIRVSFDAMPGDADRLVLAASVDPEVNPEADLTGLRDARVRLLDASGTELDRLAVSDGRPGETALVLGSFRRRANGNWDFVVGGKGYPGGLEDLVRDYGIEVE